MVSGLVFLACLAVVGTAVPPAESDPPCPTQAGELRANLLLLLEDLNLTANAVPIGDNCSAETEARLVELESAVISTQEKVVAMSDQLTSAMQALLFNQQGAFAALSEKLRSVESVMNRHLGKLGDLRQEISQLKVSMINKGIPTARGLNQFASEVKENALCREGYFPLGSQCFSINSENPMNWMDARSGCQASGGDLADPINLRELINIVHLKYRGSERFWLGGSDATEEGVWVGVSGRPIDMSTLNWMPGEPNNQDNEDCLEIFGPNLLNDSDCNRALGFICEINPK